MPCDKPHRDELTSAVADFSPGIVADEEWLLRIMLNPDHLVDGQVITAAIPLRDLQTKGFSVDRLKHVTPLFVNKSINRLLARTSGGKKRYFVGVARFTAARVREIEEDGRQVFVVIDTALSCNPGHASIYFVARDMKGSKARQLREELLPLLVQRTSVELAFAF